MKKLLICEDDIFLSNAYKVKFTKSGYEIKQAYDGKEALEILASYTPDLIILDLIMPVKDGFFVLENLSKNETWKKIPCIVASNLGQKEDLDKALALGARDYIIKSDLSMNKIMEKIEAIISR